MKLRDWESSGREPWVFRVETTDGLVGIHARLIESRLGANEKPRLLLYAPMTGARSTPFGSHGERASHALAVLDDRLLVSSNPHRRQASPSVCAIPFERILWIESGTDLLLAWLVIRYVDERAIPEAVLLYPSSGYETMAGAIRACRASADSSSGSMSATWTEFWNVLPPDMAARLKPLLLENESLVDHAVLPPIWKPVSRWRRRRLSNMAGESFVALTSRALLLLQRQTGVRKDDMPFGMRVLSLPKSALREADIMDHHLKETRQRMLRLRLGHGAALVDWETPLADEIEDRVRTLLTKLAEWKEKP